MWILLFLILSSHIFSSSNDAYLIPCYTRSLTNRKFLQMVTKRLVVRSVDVIDLFDIDGFEQLTITKMRIVIVIIIIRCLAYQQYVPNHRV